MPAAMPDQNILRNDVLLIGAIPPPKGGVSIHVERLAARLADQGIRHEILDESKERTDGFVNLRSLTPWRYLALLRRSRIVHIHSSNHFIRLVHTLSARGLGRRVVHTVHSSRGSGLALWALRQACRSGHARIGVSQAVASALGGTAHVIPAFITPRPEDEKVPADIATWLDLQRSARRRIIAVNAFNTAKIDGTDIYGLDLVIRGFEDARVAQDYSAILCLSTTGPNEADFIALLARITELGLDDRIRVVTKQVSFAGVLRQCDLFVRPTITDGDAISVREALWYGKPVIASDAAVRPQGTILFASRNANALVEKILQVDDFSDLNADGRDFAEDVIGIYQLIEMSR